MKQISQEQIDNAFETLPEIVKNTMNDLDIDGVLHAISNKYDLDEETKDEIDGSLTMVFVGLASTDDFVEEILKESGIETQKAISIIKDLEDMLIAPFRRIVGGEKIEKEEVEENDEDELNHENAFYNSIKKDYEQEESEETNDSEIPESMDENEDDVSDEEILKILKENGIDNVEDEHVLPENNYPKTEVAKKELPVDLIALQKQKEEFAMQTAKAAVGQGSFGYSPIDPLSSDKLENKPKVEGNTVDLRGVNPAINTMQNVTAIKDYVLDNPPLPENTVDLTHKGFEDKKAVPEPEVIKPIPVPHNQIIRPQYTNPNTNHDARQNTSPAETIHRKENIEQKAQANLTPADKLKNYFAQKPEISSYKKTSTNQNFPHDDDELEERKKMVHQSLSFIRAVGPVPKIPGQDPYKEPIEE